MERPPSRQGYQQGSPRLFKFEPWGQSVCGENGHHEIESRRACPELVEWGRLNLSLFQIRFFKLANLAMARAFGDPKSSGNKPPNEGHGFSRAIKACLFDGFSR